MELMGMGLGVVKAVFPIGLRVLGLEMGWDAPLPPPFHVFTLVW